MTSVNDPIRDPHIAARRRKVAALRMRHLTQREIATMLPVEPNPIVSDVTGEPYDLATISRDLKHIEEQWRKDAIEDLTVLKGKHVAELREVRRAAWQQNKLFYVLKALEQEAKVLGLEELPQLPQGVNIFNFDLGEVPLERLKELDQLLDSIAGESETITIDADGDGATQGQLEAGDRAAG